MAYSDRSAHNEGREPVMRDVRAVLSALREGSTENPDVLAIESYNIMLALGKGFPKHMYHQTLDPVVAADKQDEDGLKELGYQDRYIPRDWPKMMFRRNWHPRHSIVFNQHGIQQDASQLEFIETRIVKDEHEYKKMLREPKPAMPIGVQAPGPWVDKVTDIPPIEAETEEDKMLQKARLQAQLEEAHDTIATFAAKK